MVNASMNPQQMNQMMKQFAMETEKMNIQQEMMQDQFDMIADPETDQQADDVYNQILGEVGMQMNNDMATNTNQIAQPAAAPVVSKDDLEVDGLSLTCSFDRKMRWIKTCKPDWQPSREEIETYCRFLISVIKVLD